MSAQARSDPPHRLRITVPASDTSVLRWLEVQESPSISLRMLVRAAIERDGYTDVLTRPVEQLPRRGRPVAETPNPTPAARYSGEPTAIRARDSADDHPAESVDSGRHSRAGAARKSATAQAPEPQKQYSIDEIMSSTRR
ncbi:hypothetical protein [Flexivirga alba]|uniref:CopG family transcriptional regulator n=1 Tax=Flexivirga alba TaxID=702742 RepID=A0ABW2ABS0_9MICO